MANTSTDLTEEDAADLQFPKGESSAIVQCLDDVLACSKCSDDLETPYIFCVICRLNICRVCFANGVEFQSHFNNHDYQVIRDNFPVFKATDWSAGEEIGLLDGLCRYGNWYLVAELLPGRSADSARTHYERFYLTGDQDNDAPFILPTFGQKKKCTNKIRVRPYRFQVMADTEEPPRFGPNSTGYQCLAGYNAARADFESDYDMNAEDVLTGMDEPDEMDVIGSELQYALVRSYNRRLRERHRWRKIIREHGLISYRKVHSWMYRYAITVTQPLTDKLLRFTQFCTNFQFEHLLEGLHRSGELKIQIARLAELRERGVSSMYEANIYLRLRTLHESCESELAHLHRDLQWNWRHHRKVWWSGSTSIDWYCGQGDADVMCDSPNIGGLGKRSGYTPIEIVGMPSYEKLTVSERELCRTVRLVPIAYLELKELLMAESHKSGSIKLKTARKMLKIDVNKTRRLFDFLVQEAYIKKSV